MRVRLYADIFVQDNRYMYTCVYFFDSIQSYVKRRFSRETFTGLSLTMLVGALVLVTGLLGLVVTAYLNEGTLVLFDVRVAHVLYALRSEGVLRFFQAVSVVADIWTVVFLGGAATVLVWINRKRVYAGGIVASLALGEGLVAGGKLFFERERPDEFLRAISESTYSFPSGHATMSVVLYGFLLYLVYKGTRSKKIRTIATAVFVALVILVDMSRLYLGVHYPADVIAGNLVGLFALILGIIITELVSVYGREHIRRVMKPSHTVVFLGMASVFLYVVFQLSPAPVTKAKEVETTDVPATEVIALFDDGRLPRFSESITASSQQPIHLIVLSPRACFVESVARGGWVLADDVTWKNTTKFLKDATLDRAYPTAPMTPSFFNAEPHAYGFQKETEERSVRSRHHARFWETPYNTPLGGLYVGTASLDIDIKWGGLTHRIDPDIDTERDVFFADMVDAGVVIHDELIPFVPPTSGKNFGGDSFFTAGHARFMIFSPCGE